MFLTYIFTVGCTDHALLDDTDLQITGLMLLTALNIFSSRKCPSVFQRHGDSSDT